MICEIDDLKIYYEMYGDGIPVLMIHGYGIDHNVMTGCLEPIFRQRQNWKRFYVDLPGMGLTKANDWLKNSDDMLRAVIRFCKEIIPDRSFSVAGESYGGYLTRGLVHQMPEHLDGVLLICPVIITDREKRDLPQRRVFIRDAQLLAGIEPSERKMFERMLVVQDKRRWERFQLDILPGMKTKDVSFTNRFKKEGYSFSFDVDKLEHPFDKPSLILAGRQDASVGYADLLKIFENYSRGTFVILDRAGHGLEVEQEVVFNCMVDEWLDRVEEYRTK
ncbi:MAG TPA: alpha/beta hydrolase [Candidatus Acidoferrales bacterium]|nr:alpha/beta hydrolase [Candidatus Acidoferrales bacterium]